MQVPDDLKNIDLNRTLRRRGIMRRYRNYRKNLEAAKELVRSQIKTKEATPEEKQRYASLTNAQAQEYHEKRIHLVHIREDRFKAAIVKYLGDLEQKVLRSIRTPKMLKNSINKDLYDDDTEISSAVDLFTPLLKDITQVAGQSAIQLINASGTYIVRPDVNKLVEREVAKFAKSLLDTDRARLSKTIEDAFNSGSSVAEVQNQVESVFGDIKKYQSERIARTELLRASNFGALDAYKESGVVSGTQWVVDGNPCPECIELDGQIISLDDNWFSQGDSFMSLNFDYGSVDSPPLHPNCECTIVPVIEDVSELKSMKQELEEYKEYATELENKLGIGDE